jgi:hypothetical protein
VLTGSGLALSAAVWNSVSVQNQSVRKSVRQRTDGVPVRALCSMDRQVCSIGGASAMPLHLPTAYKQKLNQT